MLSKSPLKTSNISPERPRLLRTILRHKNKIDTCAWLNDSQNSVKSSQFLKEKWLYFSRVCVWTPCISKILGRTDTVWNFKNFSIRHIFRESISTNGIKPFNLITYFSLWYFDLDKINFMENVFQISTLCLTMIIKKLHRMHLRFFFNILIRFCWFKDPVSNFWEMRDETHIKVIV